MKKYIILLVIAAIASQVNAQNATDALRFSEFYYGSTARSLSLSGAMGALGGDQASLGINPAGLGVYRKSEFSFTPYLSYTSSTSNSPSDEKYSDFDYGAGLSGAGLVLAIPTYNESGIISFNLSFSYNQQNVFNKNMGIRISSASSSILDDFTDDANLGNWYYTGNELALETDLIYEDTNGDFRSDYAGSDYGQSIRVSNSENGYAGEYLMGMAANINNNLYLGFNLGINTVHFDYLNSYNESNIPSDIDYLQGFTYNQSVNSDGLGINGKVGIIYTPTSWLRLGAAIHTPVFYSMEDSYSGTIEADLDIANPVKPNEWTNAGKFDYSVITPPRVDLSAAILFGKVGLISVDFERVDYSAARLRSDSYAFDVENDMIQAIYKPANNLRVGAELRNGAISYRLGVAYYDSPYQIAELNSDAIQLGYSGGIGVNLGSFYIDLAYLNRSQDSYYIMYQQAGSTAQISDSRNQFQFTFGTRF